MEQIIDNGVELTEAQVNEFVGHVAEAEEAAASAEAAAGIATEEEFTLNFCEFFDVVGELWDMPDFKINREKVFELAGVKITAAKLYKMALKYPHLHFLIEPKAGWFGDSIAVACFVGSKSNIVCRRATGNGLAGYVKRFGQKIVAGIKNNKLFARFYNEKNSK